MAGMAIGSAWIGLLVSMLSVAMWIYRPLFNDGTLPVVLYGATAAIALGGLVLMRRRQASDRPAAVKAQGLQAKVGIALGMFSFMLVYILLKLAQPMTRG